MLLPRCNHENIVGVPTLSKNLLIGSSIVFGDTTDFVIDDEVPVKYKIERLSNALWNEDHQDKAECYTTFCMIWNIV